MDTPPTAANAFSPAFLDLLPPRDATAGGVPPELAGPWTVQSLAAGGWGVIRPWEGPAAARPLAVLTRQDAALLLAAVASAAEARPAVSLGRPGPRGVPLEVAGEPVGHLGQDYVDLATGLALTSGLARAPFALALLLGGAGSTAVRLTGEALYAWVAEGR